MTVHLVKLCVGADDIDDLVQWQNHMQKTYGKVFHTTRMVPRRVPDLLENGSIYWVIKRQIRVRQVLTDIEEFVDDQGIRRCHLHLNPSLVTTRLQARRPFQGWRYLTPQDAPPDMPTDVEIDDDMPEDMRHELSDMGLL
ncbi:MAG TPA: DUF1489 domain-containing protein [Rhodobiaceae bacterium]|nr:DUF1489 domain-containing protein [Rhodobiaceae bacterium]|tara:strand:- start:1556 stop:1975 length:420 start_codon:yes stop_codon:yes gene_type:complete